MILDYILRRLGLFFFMILMLSVFTFSLAYLFPGDPLSNLSGIPSSNFAQHSELEDKYLYNSNYFMQYIAFLGRIFQGDWGLSFASGNSVFSHIVDLLPATLELSVYALIVSVVIGVPTGILGSGYHKRWPDKLINSTTMVGYSMPVFWLALLLIMVFSLKLGWFPMSGRMGLLYEIPASTGFILIDIALAGFPYKGMAFVDALRHLTLPTIVLAMYPTTVLVRFTRESMLKVMDQNFIKTARAKGLNRRQLIMHHALRNALLPVIKQIGLQFSTLITLAMITEVIFSWPGIGRWLIDSIYQRDFPAIQGGLMAVSLFVILASITAELTYTLFDPLSRNQAHGKV
ncbi:MULTISPECIES: ABC transporter permease [Pseudoalteromonas]|jgi:cationic peptide transport system permease protein|uniref:ABC transporter permease n=3 Tax=Pseudoalteromonas TaxID=53246 RepID=A0AAP6Y4W3_9GAMM|nr:MULTISPECIES: ABC transporter permease [Pseudoalteromonas]ATC85863.1 dipeptide transport system permease protein [Pseudoalteromonas arctica A 37-1-2]MBG9997923.1 ABC transporter permease [Pseudoalteromonas sp. NSLLW24]MBH0004996.1 ABC transporter permease [Pseudoalteromonas sp. SWYJZ12]MBH0020294.1 ABC transporter permease [Pseudoalteromonas sp. SWXJ133]MBH0045579.1 ABC transporter permease [Pseudoalteromonas sp. NZS11_1]|tara:strand:+ start:3888 stop:4922 length:1035 start_codon:yes stop_codon:yes gene_type:complete